MKPIELRVSFGTELDQSIKKLYSGRGRAVQMEKAQKSNHWKYNTVWVLNLIMLGMMHIVTLNITFTDYNSTCMHYIIRSRSDLCFTNSANCSKIMADQLDFTCTFHWLLRSEIWLSIRMHWDKNENDQTSDHSKIRPVMFHKLLKSEIYDLVSTHWHEWKLKATTLPISPRKHFCESLWMLSSRMSRKFSFRHLFSDSFSAGGTCHCFAPC